MLICWRRPRQTSPWAVSSVGWSTASGVSDDTLAAIDAKAVAAIDAAIDDAKASPPPDLSELQTDIFSNQEAVPR